MRALSVFDSMLSDFGDALAIKTSRCLELAQRNARTMCSNPLQTFHFVVSGWRPAGSSADRERRREIVLASRHS